MSTDLPGASGLTNTERLEDAIHSFSMETVKAAAANPALGEDLGLTLLKRPDLPSIVLEQISQNVSLMKSRKVKLALVEHPRTPRHVSVPLIRSLFTFDLMQVALAPTVPADVKVAADNALINRMETISYGERLSLAHRASGRIAGVLLADAETPVIDAALENPRLTETQVVNALSRRHAPVALVQKLCRHAKWSVRRDIQVGLLRNPKTPEDCAIQIARSLPAVLVREVLHDCDLADDVKAQLMEMLGQKPGHASESE